jgi:putative tricarboxylic transport membrane protein
VNTLAASAGSLYTEGLHLVLSPQPILVIAGGVLIGLFVGAMPGLTANMGVAVLVPLTFTMEPVTGIAAVAGIWFGALYGGTIPAVLLNMPGTPGDIMTSLDGYPMSQRGEGGRAIGIGMISSFLGGMGSVFVLALASPFVAQVARNFGSKEFFAVTFLGLSVIAYVAGDALLKGTASALLGLAIGTVGIDTMSGTARFAFGQPQLLGGVSFIAVIIGIFGLSEVLEQLYGGAHRKKPKTQPVRRISSSFRDISPLKWVIARSSVIGVLVGAIPGAGATIASVLSYGAQKRISKPEDGVGEGSPKGIAASDAANNACTGGAMITMLSLGIPGDAITAILLGALVIHGIQPGPMIFQTNLEFVSGLFISFVIANIFLLVFGLMIGRHFPRLLSAPRKYLLPTVAVLCVAGTFALRSSMFDVWTMLAMGLLGFAFTRAGIPKAPLVLALVLGPILEENLRRMIQLAGNDVSAAFADLLSSPVGASIFITGLIMFVLPIFSFLRRRRPLPPEVDEARGANVKLD